MDFDDLDAEIDARIEAGDVEGLGALAATIGKKQLKTFVPTEGMKPMPRNKALPLSGEGASSLQDPERRIYLRSFLFYGPGSSFETYKFVETFPGWMEMAVYEYPGHGTRAEEPFAADLEALGEDAFEALKPAMDQVCEGAEMEGAPFMFIGHSTGAQVLTEVAKKILLQYGMAPSLVVMVDRAPLQYPLLSEEGKAALENNCEDLLKAYDFSNFSQMDPKVWQNDLRYACEERDPFFHKFECDMLVLTADKNKELDEAAKRKVTTNYNLVTLKIEDTDEQLQLPVEEGMSVKVLKETITGIFAYRKDAAKVTVLTTEKGPLKDDEAMPTDAIVSGLTDFKHPRYPWPHVTAIIGAGFQGVKTAMQYMVHHNENIIMFDRHDQCGGDAWHNAATKHSRIQTDFGAFNIWFGHEYNWTGDKGFGSIGTGPPVGRNVFAQPFSGEGAPPHGPFKETGAGSGVDYHPVRRQVLDAMHHACDEYGITKYVKFESDVVGLQIVGKEDAHERYYKLSVKEGKTSSSKSYTCSVIYHYPGAYDVNRQIDYPGESNFGGKIGYGMGHDNQGGKFCWDDGNMKGARGAIVGNGAFSIENVRSCCEYGASKVYLITRRKSLACPRMPCWFCHQGPIPTPAWFLLDMFKPMYQAGGFEDPYDFYAVIKAGHENVTISQSSRFGIGDVTFISHAFGILEYRVTVLERLQPKTLILKTGEKLENCQFLIKALGLLGDPRVDKLHAMTHRLGNFINGDWRRVISADATGMHAANFTTFSAGPGACSMAKQWYYLHNHPWEMYSAMDQGMLKIMPKHVLSNTQPDQTIYMANVQYEMAAGGMMGQYFPTLGRVMGDEGTYKHCLLMSMHPTSKFLEYCRKDWDRYQQMFNENNGVTHEYIPYPYTDEIVQGWFKLYNEKFPFVPVKWEGPDEGLKDWVISTFRTDWERRQQEHIPLLINESPLCEKAKQEGTDAYMTACVATVVPKRKKYMGSSPDCALDFNLSAYGEWNLWIDSDHTFCIEGVPAKSFDIMGNQEVWGKVIGWAEAKSSVHNLPK
uniref:Thioesterase domain-containing protein n=1 Tax=Alexandrium monilatum TaxID=311494 RepID=A0A7S4S2U3_9DINO|mmetsp:Transcript_33956/g.101280  ORF Transcript_33956/g.101280 Transcript_33956/m.101280 type:complete len:1041 (-) Transcript_33956:64-3186(-)